jgi:hypothetical protein
VKQIPAGCTSSSCVLTLGGGFNAPSGVAVDGNGNVYVGDSYNNAVKQIPAGCASSSCVTALDGHFNSPSGIALDGSGNLYVAESGNNSVDAIMPRVVLPTTPVGQSSASPAVTFTFGTSGNIAAPVVLTEGATGLDFSDAGTGTCTTNGAAHTYVAGDTCTVQIAFSPKTAGLRRGAVQLKATSGAVIATAYAYGTGTGP